MSHVKHVFKNKNRTTTGFLCTCGKRHDFPLYVFAHWKARLSCICGCGQHYEIYSGKIKKV